MTYKVAQWATDSVGVWEPPEDSAHPDLELVGVACLPPRLIAPVFWNLESTSAVSAAASKRSRPCVLSVLAANIKE